MESIASAFLDPVCQRVIGAALEEYKLVRNVEEELKKLRSTVSLIKGVLQDAEEKEGKEKPVHDWLRSLKQVLYDAEDILDEAATNSVVGRRVITGIRAKVCNIICCFGIPDKILGSHGLAHQIKDIRSKLDGMYKEKDGLGLLVLSRNNHPVLGRPRRLQTDSLLSDEVIGRDDEKGNIITRLLVCEEGTEPTSDHNNPHVLALVGAGGVGKTTLAKLVFDDVAVKQYFQLRIWVCVSEDFELKRITREIMEVISSSREKKELFEILNWDLAQKRVKEGLEEQRFLLVLDDVWEEDPSKWERLYEPLKYGGKGSKVIVTTRKQRVSQIAKAFSIPLKSLSSENLWPIFKKYAFEGYDSSSHMQLETVGRQIVERLKGLPLAAKTIGRLLNRSLAVRHWKNILNSEIFKLEQHPDDISPVLKLSYDHLPGHLKQCFAYCSLFPKDYEFDKGDLAQYWMAQHFIPAEYVQGECFDDLLYMSLFDQSMEGGTYVMHDLIHDLAESISEGDCLRLGDDQPKELSETVRHVSITTNSLDPSKMEELCTHGNLRSLLLLNERIFDMRPYIDDLFMKLKRLRVLALPRCNISELPTSIGTLKHLRFIDLSFNVISNLPESLCLLCNLQVLKLQGCCHLVALPNNMSALVNLTHLEVEYYELVSSIQGLGKLTALQELGVSGSKVSELGDMRMLRELEIRDLEKVGSKEEAVQARLDLKEHLEELQLSWGNDRLDLLAVGHHPQQITTLEEEALDGLQPADSVMRLGISNYGGVRSPRWMEDPSWVSSSFLETVTLHGCGNWEVLPPLGQLPCLKLLSIWGMKKLKRIGPDDQLFPSLEELAFHDMPEWEDWEVRRSHRDDKSGQRMISFLPRLRRLEIYGCPKLKQLPPLPCTLEELTISGVGLMHLPKLMLGDGGVSGRHTSSLSSSLPSLSSPMSVSSSLLPSSLSKLYITKCPNLVSLNDGLLQQPLPKLLKLEIDDCEELASLPITAFGNLSSLKKLTVCDCPKLVSSSLSSVRESSDTLPCSLERLNVDSVVHSGDVMEALILGNMHKLTSLSEFRISVGSLDTASLVLGSILQHPHMLAKLRTLAIRVRHHQGCSFAPSSAAAVASTCLPLEEVEARLGDSHLCLTSLEIEDCSSLLLQVMSSSLPSSLEKLSIKDDGHLDEGVLSTCLRSTLTSLRYLSISNCPLIKTLPTAEVFCRLAALERLEIEHCNELMSLGGIHTVTSLQDLKIRGCPKLLHIVETGTVSPSSSLPLLPPTTRFMTHLKSMWIWGSSPQQITRWLRQCSSLQRLGIWGCPQLITMYFDDKSTGDEDTGRELEGALLNLAASLRDLDIMECENLRCLPSKLRCLSSLERLDLHGCPQIQCLPAEGLPPSLEWLSIHRCPALEERCRVGGSDRPLISHIPAVYLDSGS